MICRERLPVLAIALTWMALSAPALAQNIDIKGIRIGMSQFEMQDMHGQLPLQNFTVAGVPSSQTYIDPDFLDGKLEKFEFFFVATSFNTVLAAVRRKLPALACRDGRVASAMGKLMTQTQCTARDKKGDLLLTRYSGDLLTSALVLRSNHEIKRVIDAQRSAEKDI